MFRWRGSHAKKNQIAVLPETELENGALFALFNDGSLWSKTEAPDATWDRIQDIPQDEVNHEPNP